MAYNFNTREPSAVARAQVQSGQRPSWWSDRFVNIDWVVGDKRLGKLGSLNLKLTDKVHARLIGKLDSLEEDKRIALLAELLAKHVRISYVSVEGDEQQSEEPIDLFDRF